MQIILRKYKQFLSSVDRRVIPLLAVHIIILFFFIVIINSFFLHFQKDHELETKQNQLYSIEHDIKVIKTHSDFLSTEDFKEEQAKDLNYKKEGEHVLSSLNIEFSNEKLNSYIPSKDYEEMSNFTIWYNCFVNPSQDCID